MLTNEEILDGAKNAFFAAMLAGYAGDNNGSVKTKGADGEVTIEFVDGDYRVLDRYLVSSMISNRSAGTTTIFFRNAPIWWMSYGGMYPRQWIPFLKTALRQTYKKGVFLGGRGPHFLRDEEMPNFIYQNIAGGDFLKFSGREEIRNTLTRISIGYHEYQGMSLLDK